MYRSNVPDCSGVVGLVHQFCFLCRECYLEQYLRSRGRAL